MKGGNPSQEFLIGSATSSVPTTTTSPSAQKTEGGLRQAYLLGVAGNTVGEAPVMLSDYVVESNRC
jgi:hypothetical protein